MQPPSESSPTCTVPTIRIDVHIAPGTNGRKRTVTYDPPPKKNGYQFPRDSEDGQMHFRVKTPGYSITGFEYHPISNGTPTMTPEPGPLKKPKDSLRIDFDFDGIQEGELRLHLKGADVEFYADPQVGNDGETRREPGRTLQIA